MSEVINFDGVSDENVEGQVVYVKPGAQVLTVKEGEAGNSAGGTPFLNLTLASDKGGEFKHKFYLSPKALPKVQHMFKNFTGEELKGDNTTDQMIAKLVGKSANTIVDGETVNNQKGNKVTYPTLRFRGWATPLVGGTPFTDADIKIEDKSVNLPATNPFSLADTDDSSDDLPF